MPPAQPKLMNYYKEALAITCIMGLAACGGHDSDYIPYRLTSLQVYLYDAEKAPNADYYAGTIPCSYSEREEGLQKARALAYRVASQNGIKTDGGGRYYIICCMTKDGCATKVR
jgi:hypothetical protein